MTVDCDGVLAASVEAFLQFYDHKILGKSVKIDDLYDHRYHNIPELGLDKPTAIQLRMRFFEEVKLEDFYPEPGALEAMQKLQQQ